MRFPSVDSLIKATWYAYSDEPIQVSPWYKPRLCDPVIIMPEESPDGIWHLFAHTWVGIEHYTSPSGFNWQVEHVVVLRGHYPNIFKEDGVFYLLYETHDKDYLGKRRKDKNRNSRINIISSTDLKLWSAPHTILDSKDIPYAGEYTPLPMISRPQLVVWQGRYRLYFGSSHIIMPDTKQKVTVYLSYAEADSIDGPYVPLREPVLESKPDSKYTNLALGSVKMIPCCDGFAALECAFYFDPESRKSRSAMILLSSEDGYVFKEERIIMLTPEKGWASRYITSCDAFYRQEEETWYCYFSANGYNEGYKFLPVRESLGLLLGHVRV